MIQASDWSPARQALPGPPTFSSPNSVFACWPAPTGWADNWSLGIWRNAAKQNSNPTCSETRRVAMPRVGGRELVLPSHSPYSEAKEGLRAMRIAFCSALLACLSPAATLAQTTQERGADGVLYNVTRTTIPKTVVTTEIQTREETVYRPQTTTQYQTYQQTTFTPATEYRLVSRQRGKWNPFRKAYWTHDYQPVTRWESRPTTVQVPVTTTTWAPEKRVTRKPVAVYKTVQDTIVQRVPIGPAPAFSTGGAQVQVASRPAAGLIGGERLDQPSQWTSGGARYR